MFILTYKAQINKITLEFGLAPRSLGWVLIPKTVLAVLFGLVTGTVFLVVIRLWLGYWPGGGLWAVWLLAGLVGLFWSQVALAFGLQARTYMAGAIGAVLGAMIIFFIGGGLSMVRAHKNAVTWIAWMFPNTYAVDPIRDLVLFDTWPADFWAVLGKLTAFAVGALILANGFAVHKLRRLG
jgi:ABC-2 type transport system permease protein